MFHLEAEVLDDLDSLCCPRFVTPVNNLPRAPLKRRSFDQIVGKDGVLEDSVFLGSDLYRIFILVNTVNQPAGTHGVKNGSGSLETSPKTTCAFP